MMKTVFTKKKARFALYYKGKEVSYSGYERTAVELSMDNSNPEKPFLFNTECIVFPVNKGVDKIVVDAIILCDRFDNRYWGTSIDYTLLPSMQFEIPIAGYILEIDLNQTLNLNHHV